MPHTHLPPARTERIFFQRHRGGCSRCSAASPSRPLPRRLFPAAAQVNSTLGMAREHARGLDAGLAAQVRSNCITCAADRWVEMPTPVKQAESSWCIIQAALCCSAAEASCAPACAPVHCSWRRYSRVCWTLARLWPRRGPHPPTTSCRLVGRQRISELMLLHMRRQLLWPTGAHGCVAVPLI